MKIPSIIITIIVEKIGKFEMNKPKIIMGRINRKDTRTLEEKAILCFVSHFLH